MTSNLTKTHADYPMYIHLEPLVDHDAPTVAEYATAQNESLSAVETKSYGELWRAWAHDTGSYPEM